MTLRSLVRRNHGGKLPVSILCQNLHLDWFLYDNGLRHERVKDEVIILCLIIFETRRISHLFRSALFTKIIFGFLNNLITSKVR